MYRSYRELYRRKTELRKIGMGPGSWHIGRWMSLTVDLLVVGLLAMLMPGAAIGWLVSRADPRVPSFLVALGCGFTAGAAASRANLQGKAAWQWLLDTLGYALRPHEHDGWRRLDRTPAARWTAAVYATDDGTAYATPVMGTATVLRLHRPAVVTVRHGRRDRCDQRGRPPVWTVRRSVRAAQGLAPGLYRVRGDRVVPAPPVRRSP